MPRPLPWIKLWLDSLHNPKLLSLTLAEQGAWWRLLMLAGELGMGGALTVGAQPLTLPEVARAIHLLTPDFPVLESMVAKLTGRGTLAWNGDTLYVVNFEERQAIPTYLTKEATRNRVHQYRERQGLLDEIKAALAEVHLSLKRPEDHEAIRLALASLATGKRLTPKAEVYVPGGRLDLLWEEPSGQPVAAFEIDQEMPRQRSIAKLGCLPCPSFIILRSQRAISVLPLYEARKLRAAATTPPQDEDEEGEGEEEKNRYVTVTEYERTGEARKLWKKVLPSLRRQVTKANSRTWLQNTKALGYDPDGLLVVEVETQAQADNLNRSLSSLAQRTLMKVTGGPADIQFVCCRVTSAGQIPVTSTVQTPVTPVTGGPISPVTPVTPVTGGPISPVTPVTKDRREAVRERVRRYRERARAGGQVAIEGPQ